jgi:Subtilase family
VVLLLGMGLIRLAGHSLPPPDATPAAAAPLSAPAPPQPVACFLPVDPEAAARPPVKAPPEPESSRASYLRPRPDIPLQETRPIQAPAATSYSDRPPPFQPRAIRPGSAAPAPTLPELLAHPPRGMTPDQRQELVAIFRQQGLAELAYARAVARAQGWSDRGIVNGEEYRLAAIRNGKVYMEVSDNENAAISTAVTPLLVAPYLLTGTNVVIGLWESGGIVLSNHQEFVGRVVVMDTDSTSSHATHVAGTLVAAGVSNRAMGMATEAVVYSWNTDFREAEVAAIAMAAGDETNAIQLSNHSYSSSSGWSDGYTPWRWYGLWPAAESDNFGLYERQTWQWDVLAYAAPYHLACKSAGNNRNDSAPTNGQPFQYYSGGWTTSIYNSAIHPLADGWDDGGYDTITPKGNAKNILTVGSVWDAVSGGLRNLGRASINTFSGWGPTDDGRIKPDIVGNGNGLFSSDDDNTQDYGSKSGTSMSSPNVCGSTALLLELYRLLFEEAPRASTLKGLILHTADDLGNTGPDYIFGWGLMNTHNAAEHLLGHFHNPGSGRVIEDELTTAETNVQVAFTWQTNGAIQATLCWTDPPGPIQSGVDSTNLILVNDLDLTLFAPDGTVYQPWVLNPSAPSDPATTGVNVRDNVEQITIAAPAVSGVWTAQVATAGAISNEVQAYSLFLTGHDDTVDRAPRFLATMAGSAPWMQWNSLTGKTYTLYRATNLLEANPFHEVAGVFTGAFISTSFTETNQSTPAPFFYRLEED